MKKLSIIFIVLLLVSFKSQASLLISPIRVLFEDRDRVQQVMLVNSSNETRSYRIEFDEQIIGENGLYRDMTEEEKENFPKASPYLRFSPSQVTLAPGERQNIKILARRPSDLQEGDYRSHLNFIALPVRRESNNNVSGMQMKLDMLLSYSIPVILREGQPQFRGQVDNIDIEVQEQNRAAEIIVTMSRAGNASPTGRLEAYFTPQGSNEQKFVGVLNGFNFFPDQPTVQKSIVWQNFEYLSPGMLQVKYIGERELSNEELLVGQVRLR